MGDVGLAIQRAEDKTAQMQARAGAIDELLASGALDDPTGTAKDDITLELEQLASTSDVENELARMKASIGAGPAAAAPAIEGQPARAGQPTHRPVPGQPPSSRPTRRHRAETRRRRRSRPRGISDDRPHPQRGSVGARADDAVASSTSWTTRSSRRSGRRRGRSSARRCTRLLDQVRSVGTPVPDDELQDSDLILPAADSTLDDVRRLLAGPKRA